MAWTLRFRESVNGRLMQRAIYLPTWEAAQRARELIESWRNQCGSDADLRYRRFARDFSALARGLGYSERACRRVRAALRECSGNPWEVFRLLHKVGNGGRELRVGKPPGRPAKSGLW
jgi:hypothetical protein